MKSLFFASFLFLLAEYSFAEELINYIITSDSQVNTLEGDLEAIGNVFIKNLESEGLSIEETSGDELTIFTDTGLFEFKSQNKNRVKTKIKF